MKIQITLFLSLFLIPVFGFANSLCDSLDDLVAASGDEAGVEMLRNQCNNMRNTKVEYNDGVATEVITNGFGEVVSSRTVEKPKDGETMTFGDGRIRIFASDDMTQ
ncbi:MAG: hypothetical protein AAF203_04405 [Pseudomonadota bacterium]